MSQPAQKKRCVFTRSHPSARVWATRRGAGSAGGATSWRAQQLQVQSAREHASAATELKFTRAMPRAHTTGSLCWPDAAHRCATHLEVLGGLRLCLERLDRQLLFHGVGSPTSARTQTRTYSCE